MKKIKVLIADDTQHIREYFNMILSQEQSMEVVGLAASGQEAYDRALELAPDVILMDIQMEHELAGIDAIYKIKEKLKDAKIIVITIHQDDETLFKAYAAGAMDYIVKTSSIVEIISSIVNVYNNKLFLRPEISQKILDEFSRMKNERESLISTLNVVSKLTNTEYDVLKAIYSGKKYSQIAKERFVEEVTIRTQVNKILKKFRMESMKSVIKELRELKIFDIYE